MVNAHCRLQRTSCFFLGRHQVLEHFSKSVATLYRLAQRTDPPLFRQELLELIREVVRCDGGVLHTWHLTTSSHFHHAPERVRARIVTMLHHAEPAYVHSHASSFFASLAAPQLVNEKGALLSHPLPWMRELHDEEHVRKLMLHGDVGASDGTARWILLFRCDDQDFTSHDTALLQAFWRLAMHSVEINLQYALWSIDPLGSERAIALVNSLGMIEIADDRLKELLRLEWPMMRGHMLPKTALTSLLATSSYRGKNIQLNASRKMGYLVCNAEKVRPLMMLTSSEISAVQCFARGMTYSAIADRFGVSPHTVRNQLANAYRKLGVHSKAELIRVIANM